MAMEEYSSFGMAPLKKEGGIYMPDFPCLTNFMNGGKPDGVRGAAALHDEIVRYVNSTMFLSITERQIIEKRRRKIARARKRKAAFRTLIGKEESY